MSYVLPYSEYEILLKTSDEQIIKNALQDMFEQFAQGRILPRSKTSTFIKLVNKHINSESQKVRKWAYHCACFYQDEYVIQSVIFQLKTEQNPENIIWALTALSKEFNEPDKLKECIKDRHDEFMERVSNNYLMDAQLLFGGMVELNPTTVLQTNNSADLLALSKIYAYNGLVQDKYPQISQEIIREMESHDNPSVREYSYWAQALRSKPLGVNLAGHDPIDEVYKWQLALQIIANDIDFNVSALKPLASCPGKVSSQIKTGLMRGFNEIPYNPRYVQWINSWFTYESDVSILVLLLDYMIKNCYNNLDDGTFYDALKDALTDDSLSGYIVSRVRSDHSCRLRIREVHERFDLEIEKDGGVSMKVENSGSGSIINIASHGSKAFVTIEHNNETGDKLSTLIGNVKKQAQSCLSGEDKANVEEQLSFISEEVKAEKPRKGLVKTLLNTLSAIKGSTEFAAAVADLVQFVQTLI